MTASLKQAEEGTALFRRATLAGQRLDAARAALGRCGLCVLNCATNRLNGPSGNCGAPALPRVFSAQTESGDELELIPAFTIALSGCNMRCAFCITGDASWHASRGELPDTPRLAARAVQAISSGAARGVLILGGEPTVHLPWLIEFISLLPDHIPVYLKTNGLSTRAARDLLKGLINVWIIDFKFGNDDCAGRLSRTQGYGAAVRETLLWAAGHTGLIIRHLLMPGHLECCWKPAAAWIAQHLPGAKVSLRFGYWPSWQAQRIPGLNRALTVAEQSGAMAIARQFELHLIP